MRIAARKRLSKAAQVVVRGVRGRIEAKKPKARRLPRPRPAVRAKAIKLNVLRKYLVSKHAMTFVW